MNSRPEPFLRGVALVVLDSVGIGGAPDAAEFGDEGSATLQHVAEAVGGLRLPNLGRLGLAHIVDVPGVERAESPAAAFGSMIERSPGKDTTTGHWEIAGVILERPFPTYPDGFPPDVIERFEVATGRGTLGNVAASGTEIIERLGEEHMASGKPIVYTSADSVFQIAAHLDVIPLDDLYDMCKIAREIMRGPHEVGRVIARPFRGQPGAFERTPDRKDFSVLPPTTVLDEIAGAGLEVRGVGKIPDVYGGRGISTRIQPSPTIRVSTQPSRRSAGWTGASSSPTSSTSTRPSAIATTPPATPGPWRSSTPASRNRLRPWDRRTLSSLPPTTATTPPLPSTDHSRERVPLLVVGERIAGVWISGSGRPLPTSGPPFPSRWAGPPRLRGSRSPRPWHRLGLLARLRRLTTLNNFFSLRSCATRHFSCSLTRLQSDLSTSFLSHSWR